MEVALGVLYWSPKAFWGATQQEFFCAFEGWKKRHVTPQTKGATRDDLLELLAKYPDQKDNQ